MHARNLLALSLLAGCAHARVIHSPAVAPDGAVWYVVASGDEGRDVIVRCGDDENAAAAWECARVPVPVGR